MYKTIHGKIVCFWDKYNNILKVVLEQPQIHMLYLFYIKNHCLTDLPHNHVNCYVAVQRNIPQFAHVQFRSINKTLFSKVFEECLGGTFNPARPQLNAALEAVRSRDS